MQLNLLKIASLRLSLVHYLAIGFSVLLISCGGGSASDSTASPDASKSNPVASNAYSVSANVTGLSGGNLVLQNNGSDVLVVTANGPTTFATPISPNGSYSVSVRSSPAGLICTVGGGVGSGVISNIDNIRVTCSALTYTIGGVISGLDRGAKVTVTNNGSDSIEVTGGGLGSDAFTFPIPVAYMGSYAITISGQPSHETCSVYGGSGSGAGINNNISSINLTCAENTYSIGGSITGLSLGQQLTLYNNGGDPNTIVGGGTGIDAFTFATPIAYLSSYAVTINQQPTAQTCSVSGGAGTGYGIVSNINSVTLTCATNSYSIGGTITGLVLGQQVTLYNNGGDANTVFANGTGSDAFTFASPIPYFGSYAVTVNQQPTNQVCTVSSNPTGSNSVTTNITNVGITCALDSYTVGVTITGLVKTDTLTLVDNNADPVTVTGNFFDQTFAFPTSIAYQAPYAVTIATQPSTYSTCSVNNPSQGLATRNASVIVSCHISWCQNGAVGFLCFSPQIRQCPRPVTCSCPSGFTGAQCEIPTLVPG